MDNRYIFAAVKDMKLVINDIADGPESVSVQVKLSKPEQYIKPVEMEALGELIKKHVINLREDMMNEINIAMDENDNGVNEFENRLDDEVFQFNIRGETIRSIKQAENEAEVTKELIEEGCWSEPSEPQVFTREDIDRFIKSAIINTMCVSPEVFDSAPPDYSFKFNQEVFDEISGYINKTKKEVA